MGVVATCVFFLRARALLDETGHLAHLGREAAFYSEDGKEYRAIAEYLVGLGATPQQRVLELRPFGYPLLLTLVTWLGIARFQLLQLLLVGLGLGFLVAGLARRVGPVLGAVPVVVFWLSPSTVYLCLLAMTEPLALALGCVTVVTLIRWFERPERPMGALASLALLTIVKPTFQPVLLIAVLVQGWRIISLFRGARRDRTSTAGARAALLALALGLLPLVAQLGFSLVTLGRPSVSNASSLNFGWRYFPAVAAVEKTGNWRDGHYRSPFAKRLRKRIPELGERVAFVLARPGATFDTHTTLLLDQHLLVGSNSIKAGSGEGWRVSKKQKKAQGRYIEASRAANVAFSWLHLGMLPLMVMAAVVWRRDALMRAAFACYGIAALVILSAPLVYAQGDRVVLAAIPFWASAYALSFGLPWKWLVTRVRERAQHRAART